MTTHKDVGARCLYAHYDGDGQCIICACGEHVRPHEWREHIGAAVEALSAKRDAEAAVIGAAKALVDADAACVTAYRALGVWARGMASTHGLWLDAKGQLLHAVTALRALEGDA
jgi:hypothetical protein